MNEKESLVDIFQRLYRLYADKGDNPDPNENGFFEMKKAANEYAGSLLLLHDQWKAAVVYEVKCLNDNNTIPPSIRFNKERLKHYKLNAGSFLLNIRESLLHHGFDIMELPKETLKYLQRGGLIDSKERQQESPPKPQHPPQLAAIYKNCLPPIEKVTRPMAQFLQIALPMLTGINRQLLRQNLRKC